MAFTAINDVTASPDGRHWAANVTLVDLDSNTRTAAIVVDGVVVAREGDPAPLLGDDRTWGAGGERAAPARGAHSGARALSRSTPRPRAPLERCSK